MNWSIRNVAIIIPVMAWKQEHLDMLDRCLTSITGQCSQAIVWSDGSKETLWDGFHEVNDRHRWVNFVYAAHNGKCVARNNAVEMATRQIILPCDADDELMPGAVDAFLREWDGETPLYSDIIRVHDGGVEEMRVLPEFSCEAIQKQCITPVNVFHLKSQWHQVGGWNRESNLLEDWEYNFRLMWEFGAKKIHSPLVKYYLHPDQHTARASQEHKAAANRWVREKIKEYMRRSTMGCCGKRRTTTSSVTARAATTANPRQPLTATRQARAVDLSIQASSSELGQAGPGKVWAKYFGGRGMGKHNRRGSATRTVYNGVQYGGTYEVKEADAVSEDQFRSGMTGSEFVRMQISQPAPLPTPAPAPRPPRPHPAPETSRTEITRTPVRVVREAVSDETLATYVQSMENMTLKELKALLDSVEFGPDEIKALLQAEQAGKGRIGAIKLLEKYASGV